MSAVKELDQYIQENEITLDTINQSKLQRNPISYQHTKLNSSISFNNSSYFSKNYQDESKIISVENELLRFINHLKQMQKIRIHQLQQVNAMFNYNMDFEDLINTDLATEEELQEIDENAKFEAFLLGNSIEEREDENESHQENMEQTTVSNNETKQAIEIEDDISFTDEDIITLRRNRTDRNARLREVSHAIQALQTTTTHTNSNKLTHSILQGKNKTNNNTIINDNTEKELSPRAKVLQSVQRTIALPPRSSIQPTNFEPSFSSSSNSLSLPPNQAQHWSNSNTLLSSLEEEDDDEVPPPPPSYSPGRMQASSWETVPQVGTISLQALVEDDLYLTHTHTSSVVKAEEKLRGRQKNIISTTKLHNTQHNITNTDPTSSYLQDHSITAVEKMLQCENVLTVNNSSLQQETIAEHSPVYTQTTRGKPYLINNAHRRSLHNDNIHSSCSSNSKSSKNPYKSTYSKSIKVRTPPKHPDLSISSIIQHSEDERSRSNSSSDVSDREENCIVGIGFGHRYGNKYNDHNKFVNDSNKTQEVHWEEWNSDENSGEEGLGSIVRGSRQYNTGGGQYQRYVSSVNTGNSHGVSSSMDTRNKRSCTSSSGSSNINSFHLFDMVDALESPVSKHQQPVQHSETKNREYEQQLPQSTQHQTSPKDSTTTTTNTYIYQSSADYPDTTTISSIESYHSPKRHTIATIKSEDSSCASPVPTTPTFNPVFS